MAPPTGAPQRGGPGRARAVVPAIPLPHVKRQAAAAAAKATTSNNTSSPESEARHGDGVDTAGAREPSPVASNVTIDSTNNGSDAQVVDSASPSVAAPNDHGDQDAGNQPNRAAQGEDPNPNPDRPETSRIVSPNRRHIPYPPQPDNVPTYSVDNGDSARASGSIAVNKRPQAHQSRTSHGSIHFGALHGSSNSSPAPPLSGGLAPPPGMPLPDARQPYAFPPRPPVPTSFDAYGIPGMGYPPAYQQQFGNFPPTSQGFRESPSSGHQEGSGSHHHLAGPAPAFGPPPGFGDDTASQNHGTRVPREVPYPGMGSALPPSQMEPDGYNRSLTAHLQQQFGRNEFADCFVELRHLVPGVAPTTIPGHRVVLSQSYVLGGLIRKSSQQSTQQLLVLETDDPWVRPDGFYMACQRLYGLPLLELPPPRRSADSDNVTAAGSLAERFNFALSYAAAGHLIGWVDVVRRGCQIAAQLLEVQTIETAMQFAASQYRDDGTYESFKYGIGSQIILAAVAEFIADRLPALFQLNTTVVDTLGYRRLPYDTPTPDKPVETMQGSPVVVRGTSRGHFSRGSRGQSHPHIQFGDLSLTNGTTGGPSDAPQAPLPEMNAFEAAMSRVLINLPFGQLKWLVETGPHPLLRVFQDVVREREARRARTLETIHSSGSHDLEGLQRPEPPQSNPLVVLGWHEKISFSGSFERPSLRRQWVPLKKDSKNDAKKDNAIQVADYP